MPLESCSGPSSCLRWLMFWLSQTRFSDLHRSGRNPQRRVTRFPPLVACIIPPLPPQPIVPVLLPILPTKPNPPPDLCLLHISQPNRRHLAPDPLLQRPNPRGRFPRILLPAHRSGGLDHWARPGHERLLLDLHLRRLAHPQPRLQTPQVLHAFFKYQTKPKLTNHGDLYYEGKEFEVKLRETKPGMLSRELKEALGMPDGAPPSWLINTQRYGPPPSHPSLKIPGLNAPIPLGATFGYRPGEWGKHPVDEHGHPLYGDVFGILQQDEPGYDEEPVDRSKHCGDLEEEDEPMEDDEMEEGIQSVETMSSTPTGIETPDAIELRKQQRKEPEGQTEKQLYQVLEQKEERIAPVALYGSSHTY